MKEKKKMSLAMQIFIALVLAIAAGLLMQNQCNICKHVYQTIWNNLPESCKIHRRSNRIILYYVWNHFYA